MTPLTYERLDELERVAREATEAGLVNGIVAFEHQLDAFQDRFDPLTVLALLTELRTLRASAAELAEIRHRMGEPRT